MGASLHRYATGWPTFCLKGTSWKKYLDDFVDEFDSRHDNRRIKLHWVDNDVKF